ETAPGASGVPRVAANSCRSSVTCCTSARFCFSRRSSLSRICWKSEGFWAGITTGHREATRANLRNARQAVSPARLLRFRSRICIEQVLQFVPHLGGGVGLAEERIHAHL